MRLNLMLVVAAVAGLASFPAVAAQQDEGQYAGDLRRMITEVASGTCPADIMAEALLGACLGQLQDMSEGVAALGAIQTMTFVSAEETPGGRIETYTVTFANGASLTWGIGSKQDGKYASAYTSG